MAGGGSSRGDEGKKKARIEIIPLIDVIFFLLATFVLFTLSLAKIQSLPVQLPVANNAPQQNKEDDSVTLQVSSHGSYFWNKELISPSEIAPRLVHYKGSVQTPRVLISGDYLAKFGDTVFALDQVRLAGIDQVSVDTHPHGTGR
jgi:biopolymer transport protein ExbD